MTRYQVMGAIAADESDADVRRLLEEKAYLFAPDDPRLQQVEECLERG